MTTLWTLFFAFAAWGQDDPAPAEPTSSEATEDAGASDEPAEGDKAEGDEAEGDEAEGDEAEGDEAEGDEAEGDEAEEPEPEPEPAEPAPPQISVKVWTRVGPASTSVSKVRGTIEAEVEKLAACWTSPTPAPVELKMLLRTDGKLDKVKVKASTLDASVDECVAGVIEAMKAEDAKPQFQEKLGVRVTGPPKGS